RTRRSSPRRASCRRRRGRPRDSFPSGNPDARTRYNDPHATGPPRHGRPLRVPCLEGTVSPASVSLPDEKRAAPPADDKPASAPADAADQAPEKELPVTVIEAKHPWWPLVNFGELWQHREMLYSLTMREIMRRYKQTVLGVVWAVFPVLGNTALVGF